MSNTGRLRNIYSHSLAVVRNQMIVISTTLRKAHFDHNDQLQKGVELCSLDEDWPIDLVWQFLHSKHWKDVEIEYRIAYGIFSLYKAVSCILKKDLLTSIKSLDYGLLMGVDIDGDPLTLLAEAVHSCIVDLQKPTFSAVVSDVSIRNDSGHSTSAFIESVSTPDIETFIKMSNVGYPFIITGALSDWTALNTWDVNYILERSGFRHVPVELGSKYSDEDWTQSIMPVLEFVEKYFSPSAPQKGYLAQHDFLGQVPKLREDIEIPDYCYMTTTENPEPVQINSWFGPAGTVSPLHQDPRRNLLCQVFGEKELILIHQDDSAYVYPALEDPLLFNTSQVDLKKPDLEQFPDFVHAKQMRVILKPGQMLYIPPKCWHYVQSLSPSFSLSFWFD